MKKLLFLLFAVTVVTNVFSQTEKFQISMLLSSMNKSIDLDDYDFITPDKWQLQKNKDHYLMQNMESGCLIRILEPQPSSGDLEQEAKAVFDIMYAGWQYQKNGEQQYVLSKGFLPKGLGYYMIEAGMSKLSPDGSHYDGFEDGAALVVKVGTQIVIISVRHNTSMMAHGDCQRKYETWRRFVNSFTVKNISLPENNEEDASTRIVGAWSQTESSASSEYVFAVNSNYALYGSLGTTSTSRDYNYEYLHIKTYSFQGDGSYSITGSQLRLKKRNRDPELIKFRFEEVNHGGTGWKDRLYLLQVSLADGKEFEVCYEKK